MTLDPAPVHITCSPNYTRRVKTEVRGSSRKLTEAKVWINVDRNCDFIEVPDRELWLPKLHPYNALSKLHKTWGNGSPRNRTEV